MAHRRTRLTGKAAQARKIADSLRRNANAYHNGSLTYTQIGEQNSRDWREAERLGVQLLVEKDLLRQPTVKKGAPRKVRWRVWGSIDRSETYEDVYASSEAEAFRKAEEKEPRARFWSANRRQDER